MTRLKYEIETFCLIYSICNESYANLIKVAIQTEVKLYTHLTSSIAKLAVRGSFYPQHLDLLKVLLVVHSIDGLQSFGDSNKLTFFINLPSMQSHEPNETYNLSALVLK